MGGVASERHGVTRYARLHSSSAKAPLIREGGLHRSAQSKNEARDKSCGQAGVVGTALCHEQVEVACRRHPSPPCLIRLLLRRNLATSPLLAANQEHLMTG